MPMVSGATTLEHSAPGILTNLRFFLRDDPRDEARQDTSVDLRRFPIPCRLFRLFAFRSLSYPLCTSPSSPARQQGQHLRVSSLSHSVLFASRPFRPPSGPLSTPSRPFRPLSSCSPACLHQLRNARSTHRMPAASFPTPVRSLLPAHPFLYPSRTFSPPPSPPCFLTSLSLFSHECAK